MKLENLKDLEKLVKLCRKLGIEAIEVDGCKMNLGPTPVIIKRQKVSDSKNEYRTEAITAGGITEDTQILTDELTDEQLLFYSAQGHETVENQ